MVLDILITVLTGAILVMFIEYQHIEKNVSEKYFSLMKPFYHKLTLFALFLENYHHIYTFKDNNANYIPRFKRNLKKVSTCAGQAIISGGDIPILKTGEIKQLCEGINDIWYIYDKGSFVTDIIEIDQQYFLTRKSTIEAALKEYNPEYLPDIDRKDLLPTVAGDFYVKEWQPVQNYPHQYDYWLKNCKGFHTLSFLTIIFLLLALLLILFFPSAWNDSIYMKIVAAASLILLGLNIFYLKKIFALSKDILI